MQLWGVYTVDRRCVAPRETDHAVRPSDDRDMLHLYSVFLVPNPSTVADTAPETTDGRISWVDSTSGEARERPGGVEKG